MFTPRDCFLSGGHSPTSAGSVRDKHLLDLTNMLKLHMLRVFVDQRLSAVTDDIFHRFSEIITEYESDVLQLKLELSRLQPGAVDRPGDGPEDRPEDRPEDQPAGVLQSFTPEEPQVRRQSCRAHVKLEEGGSSALEDSDIRTAACSEAKPHTDSQRAGLGVKQEADEDHLMVEISSQLEGVLEDFAAEDEQQVKALSLNLHIQPELRAPERQGPDSHLTVSSAVQIKTLDEEGIPPSHENHDCRNEEPLPTPSDPLRLDPGGSYGSDHDWNSAGRLELSSEHGDGVLFEPGDQSAPGTQNPLICNSCGREFSSKACLKKHIRNNTSKDLGEMSCSLRRPRAPFQRPSHCYSCRVCRSSFYSGGILLRHAETHCRELNSLCGVCGELLDSTQALMEHLRSHKELGSTCDVCGKKWSSIRRMEIHKRIHTGEKPYCCGFCSLAFSRKESLERHLRVHSGERPHGCGLCRRSFTRRGYLIHHMNTAHRAAK
ncbi:zinc finger protein 316-like [Cololabis saira]|uniref:zinc finger protein 316-like n=1 Tax=Cololabis saira TaxID=129043 RepID=UPI002AD1FEF8|nr:zinc finger protein 316-like [Cololabis saira]